MAHHPGGIRIRNYGGPSPLPCGYATGFRAFEATIGITRSGAVIYSPTANFFRDPMAPVGLARSTDQGRHWSQVVPRLTPVMPFHLPADPYLYVDPATGRVFFATLQQPAQCGSDLSWSDDGGDTWSHSYVGCPLFDQETVFAGPPRSSHPQGYPNVVYYCAMVPVVTVGPADGCMKSLDGGRTFTFVGFPFTLTGGAHRHCNGPTGFGRVGPDGTVYIAKDLCGQPYVAISHDEGTTWDRVRVSDLGTRDNQEHIVSVGLDPGGNVYVAWVAADRLPYLAVSRDGGYQWGRPMMVGAPGVRRTSMLEMAVGGVGRVALVYMGDTNARSDGLAFNGYMSETTNALAPDPTFLTASVNDPRDPIWRGCAPSKCKLSELTRVDYLDVELAPDGAPWAGLVDACTGPCVDGGPNTPIVGLVGRLWGGPNLLR